MRAAVVNSGAHVAERADASLALSPATLPKTRERVRPRARLRACSRRPGRSSRARCRGHRAGGGAGARRAAAGGARRAAVPARGARRGCPPRGGARGRAARGGARRRDRRVRRGDARTGAGLVRGGAGAARRPSDRPPAAGEPHPRATTSRTSWARTTPAGRWRSPRRAGTTCCWSGHPVRARRCSRSGSPALLPELSSDEALALAAIRSVAGVLPAEGAHPRRRSRRRTTRRRWRHWSAGERARQAGRGVARAPGHALHGRGARVQEPRPRRAAHPAGGGRGPARPGRGHGALSRAVPARARGEPVPVRARARSATA